MLYNIKNHEVRYDLGNTMHYYQNTLVGLPFTMSGLAVSRDAPF